MTWVQIGVGVAGVAVAFAGVAMATWLGVWNMADRRFAELRAAIDRADEKNDKAHGELRAEMQAGFTRLNTRIDTTNDRLDATNTRLAALAADVHVLVGRQQERDRAPADD